MKPVLSRMKELFFGPSTRVAYATGLGSSGITRMSSRDTLSPDSIGLTQRFNSEQTPDKGGPRGPEQEVEASDIKLSGSPSPEATPSEPDATPPEPKSTPPEPKSTPPKSEDTPPKSKETPPTPGVKTVEPEVVTDGDVQGKSTPEGDA